MTHREEAASAERGQHQDSRAASAGHESMSQGLVDLMYRIKHKHDGYAPDADGLHCDVLIIGSGYGGSVSAAALAEVLAPDGSGPRIWLLERGQAYAPGEFPNQLAELPAHVRFNTHRSLNTKGQRSGLFDVRVSDDVSVLVASGLGGGSLINAGVMDWPVDAVLQQSPWPVEIGSTSDALRAASRDMARKLGAFTPDGRANTIERQEVRLAKHEALRRISTGSEHTKKQFTPTAITVAMRPGDMSSDNVRLQPCNHCGDCATGCNQGAKISLDTSLLASAARRGVKLFTGATVLRLSRRPHGSGAEHQAGWVAHVNHTDQALQWRAGKPFELRARRIIVAAGTLGSTGLLLRSASADLQFSSRLGERFSANGDLVMAAYNQTQEANAVADETQPPDARRVGPTITAMIDRRVAPAGSPATPMQLGHVIQDLAVPGALSRFFSELHTTAHTVHRLGEIDPEWHGARLEADPCAVHPDHIRRTLPLAIIGHDTAQGRIHLVRPELERDRKPSNMVHLESDAAVTVSWPDLRLDPRFDQQLSELHQLMMRSHTHGVLLPNPGWKPVPKAMEFLVDGHRGPLFTAHPLGGCAMGSSASDGVVNHLGQVFMAQDPASPGPAVHEGLVVLDGSIIPTSLGINPSLTISVLADRAIRQLITLWGLGAPHADQGAVRDRHTAPAPPLPEPQSTWVEITERMQGCAGRHAIRITLRFQEVAVEQLLKGTPAMRTLEVDPAHSMVEVFDHDQDGPPDWARLEKDRDKLRLHARVGGTLNALHRAGTCAGERIAKAGAAWFFNRGLRDITQHVVQRLAGLDSPDLDDPGHLARLKSAMALASRGGEVRLMAYALHLTEVIHHEGPWTRLPPLGQTCIAGTKRVSYTRRGNPWDQLMNLSLETFPGLNLKALARPATLKLDLGYLARIGVPLLRITRQRDMPSALMDLIALALLFARILMSVHVWTMRAPDTAPPRHIDRLPGTVPGLPPPEITDLDMGEPPLRDGTPVRVRLTRYPARPGGVQRPPLVMLHGYSASGTTFAHHSVQPGLAKYMWDRGHDVWLLDMRTSAGLPTATCPWTFEDAAYRDIPIALGHVADACGAERVDVFAHCMGSAMLWMALLVNEHQVQAMQEDPTMPRRSHEALIRLRGQPYAGRSSLIRRLGMSQIAPMMHFSEGNLLRAYVMRYLRHYLPLGPYRFRPEPGDTDTNQVLDQVMQRILATIPYPSDEFDIEHPVFPPWKTTPWARTRRRMDALYGRDFNIQHLGPDVLTYIDDHFGPLSLDTLGQALHLARNKAVSDQHGRSMLTQQALERALLGMDALMSVHGQENGLSDIQGMHAFTEYVGQLDRTLSGKYAPHPIPHRGHQDCLIGRDADTEVFRIVADFFAQE